MLGTHALELPELPEEPAPEAAPRLALAGGSSRRPPDDRGGGATVIPFPQEPRRPEPLWPYWMAHVLTRYRGPDGGGGGPGVFI